MNNTLTSRNVARYIWCPITLYYACMKQNISHLRCDDMFAHIPRSAATTPVENGIPERQWNYAHHETKHVLVPTHIARIRTPVLLAKGSAIF